jgi:hypothetical protein
MIPICIKGTGYEAITGERLIDATSRTRVCCGRPCWGTRETVALDLLESG